MPISATVVGGRELEERGATGISEYASAVPGMSFTAGNFGGFKVVLRGMSLGSGFEEPFPSTQLLIGETPVAGYRNLIGLGHGIDPRLLDIERIEVLRGPQGTLYGASAIGGTVRIVPNAPDPSGWSGFVGATSVLMFHGGTGYSLEAMGNLPFENGALRIAGYVDELPGWIDNTTLNSADVNARVARGGRLALRFETGKLRTDISYVDQQGSTEGLPYDEVDDPPYEQTRAQLEPTSDDWSLLNVTLDYSAGSMELISSTSFFDFGSVWLFDLSELIPVPASPNLTAQRDADDNREFTQEVRLQSVDGTALDWLFGAFFQHREYELAINTPSPGYDAATGGAAASAGFPDDLYVLRSVTTHDQAALFGSVTRRVTTSLEIEAGVRWYRHAEEYEEFDGGVFNQPQRTFSAAYSEYGTTPRLSIAWRPTESRTYYLSWSKGFIPGGSNSQDGESAQCAAALAAAGYSEVPDGYGAQEATSWEAGAKIASPQARSAFNLAAYSVDWNQFPEGVQLACTSTNAFFQVTGQEHVANKGVEVEYTTDISEEWAFGLRSAYQDTYYSGSGTRVPGVPWFSGSLAVTRYLGDFGYLRLDHTEVGESAENFASGRTFPAYAYTNFALAVRSGAWEYVARIDNVSDDYVVVGGHRAFLGKWLTTLPPRTLSVGVRRSF